MMCQNYESVVIPHRVVGELLPTLFVYLPPFNTFPGDYAESVIGLKSLYVSGDQIILVCFADQIYWPGYNAQRLRFNAATGEFLSRDDMVFSVGFAWSGDITQGANNQLYITSLGDVFRCTDDYVAIGSAIDPNLYDEVGFDVYFFDELRNRALIRPGASTGLLKVCEFASGSLLYTLSLPGAPEQIASAGGTNVYILMSNKGVLGLDYATGRIFSYTRIPQIGNTANTWLAWNAPYQRMLTVELTPDNVDGSSTTVIKGYRNVPIATHVCEPIPLKRLRKGVKSPVLIKQIGDFGEGITGTADVTSVGTAATVMRQNVALDGDGEGVTELMGDDEGVEEVTVSVEVACQL
jgi:hypothetical protein